MTKLKVVHRCQSCGASTPQWLGRCPECGEWGSLVEEVAVRAVPAGAAPLLVPDNAPRPIPIAEITTGSTPRRPTGIGELDRVLGGGLVAGSVTLVAGEPGIGKSTLLLQAMAHMARAGARTLLVSAEESAEQVRLRAERLGALAPSLWLLTETVLPHILGHADQIAPDVLVVDSIQTVFDPELASSPGSVAQVREGTHQLVRRAKETGRATVVVGHVTKEGAVAGPRVLEHVVDTVLSFEGERHHALRLLRAVKHRFGSTDELGLFEMAGTGLVDVPDPSALFLADRRVGTAGSAVAPVIEGARPLLVEVQALVAETGAPMPRRASQGFDASRLPLLLGVLGKRADVDLSKSDVYASIAGGVRVNENGADLALCLALVSAHCNRALPADVVAVGEVGLGGEVRQVPQTARRLAEAARLGFTTAIVPASAPRVDGIRLVPVDHLRDAVRAVRLAS